MLSLDSGIFCNMIKTYDCLSLSKDGSGRECINQCQLVEAENGGDPLHVRVVRDLGRVEVGDDLALVLDVAHVEEGGQDLEDVPDIVVGHHQDFHRGPDVGKLCCVVSSVANDTSALKMDRQSKYFYRQMFDNIFTSKI